MTSFLKFKKKVGNKMKKISLELQWAVGKKTGVGWYIYNIVKELSKSDKNDYIAEFINFMGRHDVKSQIDYDIKIKQNKLLTYTMYNFLTKKMNISHNLILGTKSDIYHFFNFTIPKNIKGKVIVTIYDTVFFSAPETMGDMKAISEYKYAAERSDLILTISESAKSDIIKHFNVDEKKIEIVTPGIDLEKYLHNYTDMELENVRKKYKLPENYILYLGTIEPRKNIERTIKAFIKYKKEVKDDLKFVIVGGKGWKYDNIMKLIESMGTDIILTGYIDEEDKIPIYKLAQIFAFPSLYEGFGMPVLEAMAAGVPVITSNVSSLPEVAGDAAILVDPLNEDEIFEAYKKILSDKKLQLEMIEKGLEQAKKFEWKESAKVLEQIYEKM
jgi:mannosyltransferase B